MEEQQYRNLLHFKSKDTVVSKISKYRHFRLRFSLYYLEKKQKEYNYFTNLLLRVRTGIRRRSRDQTNADRGREVRQITNLFSIDKESDLFTG